MIHSTAHPATAPEAHGPAKVKALPIIADLHTHTTYSHGQADARSMLEAARKAGLRIFGFSEHSPRPPEYTYPEDYQEKLLRHFPDYVAEVLSLTEEEADRGTEQEQAAEPGSMTPGLRILFGIEVDYIPAREDFSRDFIAAYPFDYCIGGLHFQDDWGFDFSAAEWAPLDQKTRFAIYARYYRDLESLCRSGMFHIAAHPDLIKIFSKDSFDAWLKTEEAPALVRAALTAMRDNNVLMEVSSAGLRKPCSEIYPGPAIMAMARDLGVAISFGSDAHCTNTPAYGFDLLARYAHSFGYVESAIVIAGERQILPFTLPEPL